MSARALEAALRERLAGLSRVAVAFSGGVDSTVLLHAAHAALGEHAVGVIADSPSLARRELADARAYAAVIGARLVELRTDELDDEDYRANRGDRCYHCKRTLFVAMEAWAREAGFRVLALGEITDDRLDDRPGARAAAEFGVVAPLAEAGFSKQDVRRYAQRHGLAAADKPASACLASRLPVGTRVSRERLARVEASEEALHALGLVELRVRDHGVRARVEVGRGELARARSIESELRAELARQGFDEVELAAYVPPAERSAAT